MTKLTEQQKVHALYDIIGGKGLYVNSNYDVYHINVLLLYEYILLLFEKFKNIKLLII